MFYRYQYDQLNRLKAMKAYKGLSSNQWTPVGLSDYEESIVYDPNGNSQHYNRAGAPERGMPSGMDELSYYYKTNSNQLDWVDDAVSSGNYSEDMDAQAAGNYSYDKIGNLKADVKEGITQIDWTVYGKIAGITKGGTSISYSYDAAGNRISKTVGTTTTVYVRDASGNVMSVYEKVGSGGLKQSELHLYGSSRLGIQGALTSGPIPVSLGAFSGEMHTFTRGEKFFELTNHLGNVVVTVSDKKIQVEDNGLVGSYEPELKSVVDYAPFGMGMVGRKWNAGDYRYGFNGKEMDNEVAGDGNQYDYGFRIYNPRIGRFLSVDPLTKEYPWYTPYQFAGNKPVWCIDLDGLEEALPKPPARIPMLTNASESTCIGCADRAKMVAMQRDNANLEKLKKEYDSWRTNPENFGKPIPPQYQNVAIKPSSQPASVGAYVSKEQLIAQANFDTYGQYLPGPSDIVDGLTALNELSKGNYKAAALSAFFLIPGADVFKPIKALKGLGGELLEKHLKKFGNQAEHLTKLDMQGALRDIAGNPVLKEGGGVWQHLKEVEEALGGVGNQLEKLTKDINAGKFTDEVLKQAEVIRGTLQKQKDKLTDVLNEAKKNAQ